MKEIVQKYGGMAENAKAITIPDIPTNGLSKEQEDDGHFLSKYFDTVSNKQYQQMFCNYTQPMFAKVSLLFQ